MEWIFDQAHLGVPDPVGAAAWYRQHLGATAGDHNDRVMFGDTRVIFLKNDAPAPSHGSAIDHIALSFADVTARMKTLEGSGARVVAPVSEAAGLYTSAFIEDPWGARIEVVEDPGTIGFHHVHLQVPDLDRSRDWYIQKFGAAPGKFKGQLEGFTCGGMWVLMDEGAAAPSRGHTIDHVGWRMADLRATAADLKTRGVTFTTEPQAGPAGPHAPVLLSFTEDPWGVKIELLQRP